MSRVFLSSKWHTDTLTHWHTDKIASDYGVCMHSIRPQKWHRFFFPWGVHMRATFGFKFHANLCKFLASGKQRFFHMEEAEKLTFQTIPNLPWFIPKFVRNRCFHEWLHLCWVENQSSESYFASKGCLPKHFEISFCGTYLKVGIEEQSCDFFSWELCSVKT